MFPEATGNTKAQRFSSYIYTCWCQVRNSPTPRFIFRHGWLPVSSKLRTAIRGFSVAKINGIMQAKSTNIEGSKKKSLSAEDGVAGGSESDAVSPPKANPKSQMHRKHSDDDATVREGCH